MPVMPENAAIIREQALKHGPSPCSQCDNVHPSGEACPPVAEDARQTVVPGSERPTEADHKPRGGPVFRPDAYSVRPGAILALSAAARAHLAAWQRRVRESIARSCRTIPTIAQLSPVVAERNARLAAWANANDWRTLRAADVRASAVTMPCPVRQRQIARTVKRAA